MVFGVPFRRLKTSLVLHFVFEGFKIYRLSISFLIIKIYFNICDESFEIGSRPLRAKIKILGNFRASEF